MSCQFPKRQEEREGMWAGAGSVVAAPVGMKNGLEDGELVWGGAAPPPKQRQDVEQGVGSMVCGSRGRNALTAPSQSLKKFECFRTQTVAALLLRQRPQTGARGGSGTRHSKHFGEHFLGSKKQTAAEGKNRVLLFTRNQGVQAENAPDFTALSMRGVFWWLIFLVLYLVIQKVLIESYFGDPIIQAVKKRFSLQW